MRLWRITFIAAMMGVLSCQTARAQTLGQGDDGDISLWRVLGALIACLILAALAAFALRWKLTGRLVLPLWRPAGLMGNRRRLQLVESVRLNQHVDLHIVVCDDNELLIAASGQGTQILERLGPAKSELREAGIPS